MFEIFKDNENEPTIVTAGSIEDIEEFLTYEKGGENINQRPY